METHTSKVSLTKSVVMSWWMAHSISTLGERLKGPVVL